MGEFDWDEANIGHLARHGITPAEVEEVFERGPVVEFTHTSEDGEDRFLAHGITARGRYLNVPYIERIERVRPISAFPMTRKEIRLYAPKIHEH